MSPPARRSLAVSTRRQVLHEAGYRCANNESFDRRSIDILLMLSELKGIYLSGDGVLNCAALSASGLVLVTEYPARERAGIRYFVRLTDKGRLAVQAWKEGDQKAFVGLARRLEADSDE